MQGAEHLKSAVHITPARASQSAIRAVEKAGGSVFCKYYNELALRDCVKGNTEHVQAAPTRKNDIRTLGLLPCLRVRANFHTSMVYLMAESGLPVTYGIGQDARCGRAMEDAFATAPRVQDTAVRQGEVEYISVSFL